VNRSATSILPYRGEAFYGRVKKIMTVELVNLMVQIGRYLLNKRVVFFIQGQI
jgi:hypothetical protein